MYQYPAAGSLCGFATLFNKEIIPFTLKTSTQSRTTETEQQLQRKSPTLIVIVLPFIYLGQWARTIILDVNVLVNVGLAAGRSYARACALDTVARLLAQTTLPMQVAAARKSFVVI